MQYFHQIHSLAELKKQYRVLALANHPDRGGDTEVMKQINLEFEKLFKVWEHVKTSTKTGYEDDYSGSTAKQYSDYVYNEYRWKGSNYKGQGAKEVVEIFRNWLKETYPRYTFSVRRIHYKSIHIDLIKADFTAFKAESNIKHCAGVNHYRIKENEDITDRAKEIMINIKDFVMSYNFDDSDAMTDYFHTNFYLDLGIGNVTHPYKVELPKLKGEKAEPQFRHPEGPAHKAIRVALGKARFAFYSNRHYDNAIVLGEDNYWGDERSFYPLTYSSAKTAQKRIDKLKEAGINCRLSGYNSGFILFIGYFEEIEKALEQERQEYMEALKKWNEQKEKRVA